MYKRIVVPIDLAHAERLTKALDTAAKIAGGDHATVIYTGVSSNLPSKVSHTPKEYAAKLDGFAKEQATRQGVTAETHVIESHDPSIDLADKLIQAIRDVDADLVVMASHVPGVADHVFGSKAGYVAAHAPISVFVVR